MHQLKNAGGKLQRLPPTVPLSSSASLARSPLFLACPRFQR